MPATIAIGSRSAATTRPTGTAASTRGRPSGRHPHGGYYGLISDLAYAVARAAGRDA